MTQRLVKNSVSATTPGPAITARFGWPRSFVQTFHQSRLTHIVRWAASVWLVSCCLSAAALAADESTEETLAAYADAANFQTNGAFELAIDAWNSFLKKYDNDPMASNAAHYLGVCYMQKENPDYVAASEAFARALKDKDYDLREESLANQGWCLYASAGDGPQRDADRLQRALDTFTMLVSEHQDSQFLDRALFYSGEASYGLKQPAKAIAFYNKFLALPNAAKSPLRCDALYARGVAHEDNDQFDKAIASFQQLLSSCDAGELVTDAQLRLGDLWILGKDYPKAIESFAAALKSTKSKDDQAYALFRQAFAMVQADQPGEAAKKYEQLLAEHPDSQYAASAILAAAQSTYRSGDIEAAALRFQKVLEQNNPTAATEATHWLARIRFTKGEYDQARQLAKRQLDAGAEGEFALALRLDYAEALSMDPKTVNESMTEFEKAYRGAPADPLAPRALYNAAFSALQCNQPQKALDLATEFIQRFPRDPLAVDLRFVAAEGQLQTGKVGDALDTYKHLLLLTAKEGNLQRPMWVLRAAATANAAKKYDETVVILQKEMAALPKPEQQAEAQMLMGQALLMAGRASDAASAFQASRDADKSWSRAGEASLLAGQALFAAGKRDEASNTWKRLIQAEPATRMADQARYKLAQLATAGGDYAAAIKLYDEIVQSKQDPGLIPYVQYGRGWALMQSGQYDQALVSLDQLLKDNAEHPIRNDALLARGISLRNLDRLDAAKQDLEAYMQVSPEGTNLGHALYELALIDQKHKQPAIAAQRLEQLVRDVPTYPAMDKVLYELGWSLREAGNDDAAAEKFTELIKRYPKTSLAAEAAFFVGQKNYSANNWQLAAKQFAIAADQTDDAELSEKSLYRLGWSHFKTNDLAAAEKAFGRQAEKHADGKLRLDALMMVGECRFKASDFESALAAYDITRKLIQSQNEDANSIRDAAERQVRELVLLHGGQSAAQLKQWDTAIEWYDELRKRFPATKYIPQSFYETGFAHQQKGDTAEALKFFAEVADNYRNELAARARFMMGEIYFGDRQFDKAIPEFQRVMYGFGAENAPPSIKNWQAKSGFEAGRCSELLIQQAKTPDAQQKSRQFAVEFFNYVISKHPGHDLAKKSRERLEELKKS